MIPPRAHFQDLIEANHHIYKAVLSSHYYNTNLKKSLRKEIKGKIDEIL